MTILNNKYHFLNISLRLMHRLNVDIEVKVEVGRVVRGWRYDGRSGAAADSGDSRLARLSAVNSDGLHAP